MALMGLYVATSCSDDPSSKIDYNTLKIGRMDLSGAVSIGLKNEDTSRAIKGEYLSAGMYKVDSDGKIYAVAVYFSTDMLGNRLEHEERLRIVPEDLFNLTKDYFMVVNCSYYDKDGDRVSDKWEEFNDETEEGRWIKQDVPYKHLLVRKSDGKIWCVDNIIDNIVKYSRLNGQFIESNRGDLYFVNADSDAAFKFNLSSDEASFEQITTGDGTVGGDYIVTDNGIIGQTNGSKVYFGWPHSGFSNITPYNWEDSVYKEIPKTVFSIDNGYVNNFRWRCIDLKFEIINWNNTIYLIVNPCYILQYTFNNQDWSHAYGLNYLKSYIDRDEIITLDDFVETINKTAYEKIPKPIIYKIIPVDNVGRAELIKITSLYAAKDYDWLNLNDKCIWGSTISYGCKYYPTGVSQLIKGDREIYLIVNGWLTLFNLKDNQWNMIKQLESDNYDIEYQRKLWCIVGEKNDPDYGANWLDINTEESGFIKFNVTLPDFVKYEGYTNGIITYSGADPANSNKVNIYIDITTGEAVNEVNTPEMIFNTLIPLN